MQSSKSRFGWAKLLDNLGNPSPFSGGIKEASQLFAKSYSRNSVKTMLEPYLDLDPHTCDDENHTSNMQSQPNDGPKQNHLDHWVSDAESQSSSNSQESATETDEESKRRGIIYVRVSSLKQAEDGQSISGQIEDLRELAEKHGIELVVDPIKDEGKTGKDFNRRGIQKVFYHAQRGDFDVLLVDSISRIGRTTPETLYFIHTLRNDCGIELLTPSGEVDISKMSDRIQASIKSLSADMSTHYRTRSANRTRVNNFLDKKQWKSMRKKVPLGYQLTEDGWLEVESDKFEVVQDMFRQFAQTGSYAETKDYLDEKYAEMLDGEISYNKVRKALSDPVYIGEPSVKTEIDSYDENQQTVVDKNLQIVGEETFSEVQEKITTLSNKNSTGEQTLDAETAVSKLGLAAVLSSSPIINLECPVCGGDLRRNGQRRIDGTVAGHNYQCNSCGTQRRWPYLEELQAMRGQSSYEQGENTDNEAETDSE